MRKSWAILLAGTLILAQSEAAFAGAVASGGQPGASSHASSAITGSAIAGRDNNRAVLGIAAAQGAPVAASFQGSSDKLGGHSSVLLILLLSGGLIGGLIGLSGGGDHPHSP
jgi:hypothetical protein